MQGRLTTHFGTALSVVGTNITTIFQGGTSVSTEGLSELEVILVAVFDPATTITTMDYQLQISDDLTNWDPIATINLSTAAVNVTQSLTAAAGSTVRNRIQVNQQSTQPQFRMAKYARISVKSTGASKSGDSATASLNLGD